MADGGMKSKQMYFTEQLCDLMTKAWGDGRVSANVERIVRAHLADAAAEKKLQLAELQRAISRFNGEFGMNGEIIFPEKEIPPAPPKENE